VIGNASAPPGWLDALAPLAVVHGNASAPEVG